MIRSGFKRPVLERVRTVHVPIPVDQRRGSMAMDDGKPAEVLAKHEYIRSPALMKGGATDQVKVLL